MSSARAEICSDLQNLTFCLKKLCCVVQVLLWVYTKWTGNVSANPCSCWWTGKAARAASMLLTQELQRGTGISPYWTGRKLVFKFLSVRMVKNALVGSDLCAVCSQIILQSTNDTRQKTFVLCLWTLTFLFWGRIFCDVGWSCYSSVALLGQSWRGMQQRKQKVIEILKHTDM